MKTRKELIRVREKMLRNGDRSLYLESYVNGKRTYEFLNLHIIKPSGPSDKARNVNTMTLALQIRTAREQELQKKQHGLPDFKNDHSFINYYKQLMRERKAGNHGTWVSALKHILSFSGGEDILFKEVDEIWLTRFKNYLLNGKAINFDRNP